MKAHPSAAWLWSRRGRRVYHPQPMRRHGRALLGIAAFTLWSVVSRAPAITALDLAITSRVQRGASAALDVSLPLVTWMGTIEVASVIAVVLGILLWRTAGLRSALTLWATFVVGTGVEWLLKHRLNNYPSGHAFRTTLLALTGWVLLDGVDRRLRTPLRTALAVLVLLMGVSLVYLGDHLASEVVGGILLAWTGVETVRAAAAVPVSRR
jgi:membrane-associated phospholipid phosphatase